MAKKQNQKKAPKFRPSLIRAWREHLGKSQAELADAMGINEGYLSEIETGKRRFNQTHLELAAKALGVSMAHLVGIAPPPKPDDQPGEPLDFSDPYLAAAAMLDIEQTDRERIGGLIATYVKPPSGKLH